MSRPGERDDVQTEEFLSKPPPNRQAVINRFKGLGEMIAADLKETTLDPATRVLLRVDIEAQVEADQTFTQLLGKVASTRYQIIMAEANLVEDLDV